MPLLVPRRGLPSAPRPLRFPQGAPLPASRRTGRGTLLALAALAAAACGGGERGERSASGGATGAAAEGVGAPGQGGRVQGGGGGSVADDGQWTMPAKD